MYTNISWVELCVCVCVFADESCVRNRPPKMLPLLRFRVVFGGKILTPHIFSSFVGLECVSVVKQFLVKCSTKKVKQNSY